MTVAGNNVTVAADWKVAVGMLKNISHVKIDVAVVAADDDYCCRLFADRLDCFCGRRIHSMVRSCK